MVYIMTEKKISIKTWREAPMHPIKLARIHISQEKKRRKEGSTTMSERSRKSIHPGISNYAGYQTLHAFAQKPSPVNEWAKPWRKKRWDVTDPALPCCHLVWARTARDPPGLVNGFWMHRRWRFSFCSRRMEKPKAARWRGEGYITGYRISPEFLWRSAIKGVVPMEMRFPHIQRWGTWRPETRMSIRVIVVISKLVITMRLWFLFRAVGRVVRGRVFRNCRSWPVGSMNVNHPFLSRWSGERWSPRLLKDPILGSLLQLLMNRMLRVGPWCVLQESLLCCCTEGIRRYGCHAWKVRLRLWRCESGFRGNLEGFRFSFTGLH